MPQIRVGDAGVRRREHRIAQLRQKKDWVKNLEALKGHPAWVGLSGILGEVVNTQDSRLNSVLDDTNENDHFVASEAKKCRTRKVLAEYLIHLVNNPEEGVADVEEEISRLQGEIEAAKEGALI